MSMAQAVNNCSLSFLWRGPRLIDQQEIRLVQLVFTGAMSLISVQFPRSELLAGPIVFTLRKPTFKDIERRGDEYKETRTHRLSTTVDRIKTMQLRMGVFQKDAPYISEILDLSVDQRIIHENFLMELLPIPIDISEEVQADQHYVLIVTSSSASEVGVRAILVPESRLEDPCTEGREQENVQGRQKDGKLSRVEEVGPILLTPEEELVKEQQDILCSFLCSEWSSLLEMRSRLLLIPLKMNNLEHLYQARPNAAQVCIQQAVCQISHRDLEHLITLLGKLMDARSAADPSQLRVWEARFAAHTVYAITATGIGRMMSRYYHGFVKDSPPVIAEYIKESVQRFVDHIVQEIGK